MARREQNPTVIGFTQYFDRDYWSWTRLGDGQDDARAAMLDGPVDVLLGWLVAALEAGGVEVVEAYAIRHDKDEREVWDSVSQTVATELKPPHIHGVIKFASREKSAPLNRLAALLGLEPQFVEKPGRGRFAYDNMLAYLIHIKYADKYQYDPAEVVTVRGQDYLGVYALRKSDWMNGRAVVKKTQAAESLEGLRQRVLDGEVTREQIMLTDELYAVYGLHQREIEDALTAYGQRRAYRAAKKLQDGDFSTTVIFVTGAAGAGKTRFALELIQTAIVYAASEGERWELYRAATNNCLDDWAGEEVVLLDDLRAASMTANDWLLLLDPYNASPAAARYKNKRRVAPRMIVLTAPIEPVEFFFYARQKGDVNEALDQFLRRLSAIVKVVREDDARHYIVQRVDEVDEYTRRLSTATSCEVVSLTYGGVDEVEFSEVGAVSRLLLELGQRSGDIAFSASADWGLRQELVAVETTFYEAQRLPSGTPLTIAGAV